VIVLDTSAWIAWTSGPSRLSPKALKTIVEEEKKQGVLVSAMSIWEVAAKSALGKLVLDRDVRQRRAARRVRRDGERDAARSFSRRSCGPHDHRAGAAARVPDRDGRPGDAGIPVRKDDLVARCMPVIV
jgi:predicted nucleic acid-binding protein